MILITGMAGFIGSHLAKALKNQKIIGIDNFNNFYDPKIKYQNWKNLSKNPSILLEEEILPILIFTQILPPIPLLVWCISSYGRVRPL